MKTSVAPNRTGKVVRMRGRPARANGRHGRSFAVAAERFRGMLKDGPKDLSVREGFGS